MLVFLDYFEVEEIRHTCLSESFWCREIIFVFCSGIFTGNSMWWYWMWYISSSAILYIEFIIVIGVLLLLCFINFCNPFSDVHINLFIWGFANIFFHRSLVTGVLSYVFIWGCIWVRLSGFGSTCLISMIKFMRIYLKSFLEI